jgi:acyl-CoA reductase-like NAD-dependent aldehyde dehydrogenase
MRTFDIINPATSAVLDHAPDASVDEARQSIEKSVAAFAMWKAKTPFERSTVLRKWYGADRQGRGHARENDDAGDGQAHH